MDLAIFLLAGRGTRINKYSAYMPKCLIKVDGKPLLHHMLNNLVGRGVEKSILVIGYMGDTIRESVSDMWDGMAIEYVENKEWASTNNIYSLFLANNSIDRDFYLFEGDLIISENAFDKLKGKPNFMAVSKWAEHLDGTLVGLNGNIVEKFLLKNDLSDSTDMAKLFKTVNIYGLGIDDYKNLICPEMEKIIGSGETGIYYEKAFANLVNTGELSFRAIDFSSNRWAEIDNENDLSYAQKLFEN